MLNERTITLCNQIICAYETVHTVLLKILNNLNKIIILTAIIGKYPRAIQLEIENKIDKIEKCVIKQQKLKVNLTKRIERLKKTERNLKIRRSKRNKWSPS